MIDDQYIIDRFFNKKGNLNSIKLRYIKNEELNYLKLRYIDSENLNETIWRIKLNIENKPICKYCGKYKKYYKCGIYFKTCGNIECKNKCEEETNIIKYGGKSPLNNDIIKEKFKNTCLEKYGVDNTAKSIISKNHYKETCLEKYGKDSHLKNEKIRNKIKTTSLKKYGSTTILHSKFVEDKIKQTNLKKYGTEYYFSSEESKNNSLERGRKIIEIRKNNNTLNTSSLEIYIKKELIRIFGEENIKTEYKSKLYPWNCDFYIIPLNLYIEIEGFISHGNKPYDNKDIECLNLLNNWIKNKYNNWIYNWTIRDVEKRNTAKKNNINYIELWNRKDCENFINRFHLKS